MDIEQLVQRYTPSAEAIELIQHTKIALLVGISGAGKDTIQQEILGQNHGFGRVISHTTRAPRYNGDTLEQDGVDYHFISNDQARKMLENGEFIEAKFVHGTVYGTSIAEVKRAGLQGGAINDIDVQGVAEYKKASDKVVAIFVVPPDYDTWVKRLSTRYASEEAFLEEWPKRRASAIKELTEALSLPYYHFIINNELQRAVEVTIGIASRPDTFTREDDEARIAARDLLLDISSNHPA